MLNYFYYYWKYGTIKRVYDFCMVPHIVDEQTINLQPESVDICRQYILHCSKNLTIRITFIQFETKVTVK